MSIFSRGRTFYCIAALCCGFSIPVSASEPAPHHQMRMLFTKLWSDFRGTEQSLYLFIREASEFRAYLNYCDDHHDMNVDLNSIYAKAASNAKTVIVAQFEDEEAALQDQVPETERPALYHDLAFDILGYEYAYQDIKQQEKMDASGGLIRKYCTSVKDDYFQMYVSLRRRANR